MAQSQTQIQVDSNPTSPAASATGIPTGSSTASGVSSPFEHLHFTLFSNYKGPNVGDIGSAETVNANGVKNARQRQYFDTDVMAAYKLGSSTGVGIVMPFWLITTKGQEFSLGDMGIKLYDKKAYSTKDLTIGANLILQAPTSAFSKTQGMTMGVKTTPSIRYNVPKSRFTLGAWTEAKAYVGVDAANGKLFKLWGAPFVSYQLAPKLSGILQYEYEASHFVNTAPLDFRTVQHDILTGVSYMFSPQLMVEPYVVFYTTQKLSMSNAALGAIISASI